MRMDGSVDPALDPGMKPWRIEPAIFFYGDLSVKHVDPTVEIIGKHDEIWVSVKIRETDI